MSTKQNGIDRGPWPAAQVHMWKLGRIKPYPQNPRTHPADQIKLLAQSMREEGVTMPILVDDKGVIIAGHGRLLAAQENKFTEYPVVVARGWTDDQKRAARVRDNQLGLLSGWDADLIHGEIVDLKTAGYDIALLGFPEVQLRAWGVSGGTDGVEVEQIPERPKKPIVRRGDLWVLGDHRLMCGDSTSQPDVQAALDGALPHLTVTDPPYGVEYDPSWRADANKWKGSMVKVGGKAMGKVQNDTIADWRETWKLVPSVDVIYSWCSSLYAGEALAGIEAAGFVRRTQIIWDKQRVVIGRGDYHWQHEPCWYAVRKGKTGHWNGGRTQSTVWSIAKPQVSETGHGTQKPIECMKRPIENNSRKGDAIYEPFSGSGTTIIACEMTGRHCRAIEIDPGYVEVAVERWQKFTGREATLDGVTFAEVMRARRTGRPKGARNATGNSRKPVPRKDARGNGAKHPVRAGGDAGLVKSRREPAGEPSAVARNTG